VGAGGGSARGPGGAADPRGAEERRNEAQRRAKVVLYPDQEHTATLAGQRLPTTHAAAAMARIKAMARALKAAGAGGGIDLLCAQVYIGLLLGTLPPIPPADGAPPDDPPGPPGDPPDDPADGHAPDSPPGDLARQRHGGPGAGPGKPPGTPRGPGAAGDPGGQPSGSRGPCADRSQPRDPGVPPPGDADAPRDEEDYPCPDDSPALSGAGPGDADNGWPAADWPGLPAVIPPAGIDGHGRDEAGPGRARPGLLEVSLPWQVLAGLAEDPGHLGRIGPVTASQARRLAGCAAGDPGAEWRIIVTTPGGEALAVTPIPRPRTRRRARPRQRDGPPGPSAKADLAAGIGLVSRVTLTIPADLAAARRPCAGPRQALGHRARSSTSPSGPPAGQQPGPGPPPRPTPPPAAALMPRPAPATGRRPGCTTTSPPGT